MQNNWHCSSMTCFILWKFHPWLTKSKLKPQSRRWIKIRMALLTKNSYSMPSRLRWIIFNHSKCNKIWTHTISLSIKHTRLHMGTVPIPMSNPCSHPQLCKINTPLYTSKGRWTKGGSPIQCKVILKVPMAIIRWTIMGLFNGKILCQTCKAHSKITWAPHLVEDGRNGGLDSKIRVTN